MAVVTFNAPETTSSAGVETTITTKIIRGNIVYAVLHFPANEYKTKLRAEVDKIRILPAAGSPSEWMVYDDATFVALVWHFNHRDLAELKVTIRNEHASNIVSPAVTFNILPFGGLIT